MAGANVSRVKPYRNAEQDAQLEDNDIAGHSSNLVGSEGETVCADLDGELCCKSRGDERRDEGKAGEGQHLCCQGKCVGGCRKVWRIDGCAFTELRRGEATKSELAGRNENERMRERESITFKGEKPKKIEHAGWARLISPRRQADFDWLLWHPSSSFFATRRYRP